MDVLTIRKATQDDIATIATILNQAFQRDLDEFGYEPPSYNRPHDQSVEIVAFGQTYLGFVGAEAVTTIAVMPEPQPGVYEVKALGTLPQWQGHGFGRQMMDVAHNCVEATTFTLTTPPDREVNMKFYRSFGYEVVDSFLEEGRVIDVFHRKG